MPHQRSKIWNARFNLAKSLVRKDCGRRDLSSAAGKRRAPGEASQLIQSKYSCLFLGEEEHGRFDQAKFESSPDSPVAIIRTKASRSK